MSSTWNNVYTRFELFAIMTSYIDILLVLFDCSLLFLVSLFVRMNVNEFVRHFLDM